MKLETDGIGYDLLERAIARVQGVPGAFLEIGTRKGGSMQIIIDAAIATGQSRVFVSVDPYGHIPYNNGQGITRYDYTNEMKTRALSDLYNYAHLKKVNLITYTLTDTDFFELCSNGIPVYEIERRIENRFAFVFLDGPHDVKSILAEFDYLKNKTAPGAQIVVDNIDLFSPAELIAVLDGFEEVERNTQKICFTRI
jgi:hypothetical protein